jgi:anti-sigma regulatory factor (Ser/Thr protein kinase)
VHRVNDSSQVGEVSRAGESLGDSVGLSQSARGSLAIVISEIATNLAKHARGGRIFLSAIGEAGSGGVQVIAVDDGPGIANVGRALEDGYSTGGTSGHGLGAIGRMATSFDIYSTTGDKPGKGTVVEATVRAPSRGGVDASRSEYGVVCTSADGSRTCGDAWFVHEDSKRILVVVADGLGHGPEAALASSEAIRVIREMLEATPSRMMEATHSVLRSTRGAACAIASVRKRERFVDFVGVGNIAAGIFPPNGAGRSMASMNGTAGHATIRIREFQYEYEAGSLLLMHSDGINTRWKLDHYPGLTRHHPALVAGMVYRDSLRGTDDATVIALRIQPG